MRSRLIAAAVVAVLGSACGTSFDADLMVSFEARWMCDVQRSVYDDLEDLTANFDERLVGNGLNPEIYREFKDALTDDIALRDRVLSEYEDYCNG